MGEVFTRAADLHDPTPMMRQYLATKAEYEGYILLYRLGDFFECFFEDAVIASRVLELTLTGRDCGDGNRAAMCGVPFHKADVYIGMLVEHGYRVAVCEQTEDPAKATGLVKREVVRIVTPGTVTDGSLLDGRRNNYLCALCYTDTAIGAAFADISTGQIHVTQFAGAEREARLLNELAVYTPREAVMNIPADRAGAVSGFLRERFNAMIEDRATRLYDEAGAREAALLCFGEKTEELNGDALLLSVGALLAYIRETQKCDPTFMRELHVYAGGQYMELDLATRRNLELVENLRTKEKRGSLLWVLDKTETTMGARLLRSYVLLPLVEPGPIRKRQDAVAELCGNYILRSELRKMLSPVQDIERLTARAVYGSANGRDLLSIAESIAELPTILELIRPLEAARLRELADGFDVLDDLYDLISRAIASDAPLTVREGGIIREGYSPDVDRLRGIRGNGEGWIREIEAREREATGIRTLRTGYNKVFGYYIEVTKASVGQVPDRYIRKQTLTDKERYITEELKEMESTVLGAADKLAALEYDLFTEVRLRIADAAARLQDTAARLAEIDVYLSLAEVASAGNYCRPEVDAGAELLIRDGRHPVVEKFVPDSYFVPNDTDLSVGGESLYLITGPNMAGKSTYMRQVALITLMAQIGSFVPAREATVGIADKIFTRVGASDDLASGQSTFMLEMNEVAGILAGATRRSLIIYDEVGRGTSTYDGMAIARAVVEYTFRKIGARTLFATHYHELTVMEQEFPGVVNYNVTAKKRGDTVTFLRKVVRGAADESYGIEVAKLAGVPAEVVRRAKQILAEIEAGGGPERPVRQQASPADDMLGAIYHSEACEVADRIRAADLNTLTPIEAMNLLFELKKLLKS